MKKLEFDFLAEFIKKRSGIFLTEDKVYLIESRLKPIARKYNMETLEDLVTKLRFEVDKALSAEVVDAMTTNESYFFRDTTPFEQFKKHIFPKLKHKKIRIWSAASSTGQEAYSLAMTMREMGFTNFEIYGSDISPRVVEKANEGKYSQFEVQRGLPIMMLMKYFTQVPEGWQVKPLLKEGVKFETFNLMDEYTRLGLFDVIYCRNVLIYFYKPTKSAIFEKMRKIINPEGFFALGSSETIMGITEKFTQFPGESGLLTPVK